MVALKCPYYRGHDAELTWTSHTGQALDLNSNMSSAQQRQMGVLVHGRSLVILSVSANRQGNYSCSHGTPRSQTWFKLMVYPMQSREYERKTTFSTTCYTQESCTLYCPDVNTPDVATPNITSNGIIWQKEGKLLVNNVSFPSVEEHDHGIYTCTRSYLYHDHIYNMTFTVVLDVRPNIISGKSEILLPQKDEVFHVALDTTVVINCTAAVYSEFDDLFWLSGTSFLEKNNSLPVFYNYTRENTADGVKMTASLVFRKVLKEDLSKSYTCKLESEDQPSSFVTISLDQKARPSYASLAAGIVCTVMAMVLMTVIYVKFKINITLLLRDTLGCHRNASDGKSYDAFLMCYKNNTDAGLNEEDRDLLEKVLEEKFGYSLCLYDRDVPPGKAVADAVLDCIMQSRTVVLVPTSADPGLESGLLSVIHSALVERETRLVFITTESKEELKSGSVSEALQFLSDAGDYVTWRGKRSMSLSSFFWKQLRYHLPALKHTRKISPISQRV
ncbi:hypothetical protein PFLUV_G00030520 [Xyrichtys novacula]|uniref:Uncharacterized protein n=1 Tax=Xyrichtys novacula TaxID=13765 RepID=A0AAV1ELC2_XYRNO|nr:hypothetical protein PFLUV_G00030520 [Xyrichtys novacula]